MKEKKSNQEYRNNKSEKKRQTTANTKSLIMINYRFVFILCSSLFRHLNHKKKHTLDKEIHLYMHIHRSDWLNFDESASVARSIHRKHMLSMRENHFFPLLVLFLYNHVRFMMLLHPNDSLQFTFEQQKQQQKAICNNKKIRHHPIDSKPQIKSTHEKVQTVN